MGHISIKKDYIDSPETVLLNPVREEDKGKKKQDIYAYVMMVLLDAFSNSTHLTQIQTKLEEENAECQKQLVTKIDECALQDIPQDAWENVAVYVPANHDQSVSYKGDVRPSESVFDHWELTLTHPEKLHPVTTFNQQQLQLRQGVQLSVSVLEQTGQMTISSASSSLQQAAQTSEVRKGILGSLSTAIRTIANKMRQ